MKIVGFILLAIGCVSGVASLLMDTTVSVSHDVNGWTQVEQVHNVGRMDDRRTWLICSGVVALIGTLFVGFGSLGAPRAATTPAVAAATQPVTKPGRSRRVVLVVLLALLGLLLIDTVIGLIRQFAGHH
jgi:hypothetical protein